MFGAVSTTLGTELTPVRASFEGKVSLAPSVDVASMEAHNVFVFRTDIDAGHRGVAMDGLIPAELRYLLNVCQDAR